MDKDELKPCPFCGSKATIDEFTSEDGGALFDVVCVNKKCYASIPHDYYFYKSDIDKLKEWWNNRK